MFEIRNEENDLFAINDALPIQKQIIFSINKLHEIFFNAFNQDKVTSSDKASHHAKLFEMLWNNLDPPESLKDWDSINNNREINTQQTIADYCSLMDVSQDTFSESILSLMNSVLLIRDQLKKFYNMIGEFQNQDVNVYKTLLESLQQEINTLLKNIAWSNRKKIIEDMEVDELSFRTLIAKLEDRGYGTLANFISVSSPSNQTIWGRSLWKEIDELSTISDLNQKIDQLNLLVKKKEFSAVNVEQELQNEILNIENAKTTLSEIFSDCISKWEQKQSDMVNISKSCEALLKPIENILFKMQKDFDIALKLNGVVNERRIENHGKTELAALFEKTQVLCTKQSPTRWNSWRTNEWDVVADKIGTHLYQAGSSIKEFLATFIKELPLFKKTQELFQHCKRELKELDLEAVKIGNFVSKIKAAHTAISNALNDNQQKLTEHCKRHENFFKEFFSNHWGKVLLGGTTGASCATAIAIFAFAFNPISLAILVTAGTMIGASVGGGVGLFADQFKQKNKDKLQNKSTDENLKEYPVKNSDNPLSVFRDPNDQSNSLDLNSNLRPSNETKVSETGWFAKSNVRNNDVFIKDESNILNPTRSFKGV